MEGLSEGDMPGVNVFTEIWRHEFRAANRGRPGIITVFNGVFPIVIPLDRFLAGGGEVGRLDDQMLVDRQQILPFDHEYRRVDLRGSRMLLTP